MFSIYRYLCDFLFLSKTSQLAVPLFDKSIFRDLIYIYPKEAAMKFRVFIVSVFFACCLLPGISIAQNKVVVIPLLSEEAAGNATREDVLRGKTFSNSSATGLTGTRPPVPVAKTGQTYSYTIGDDGYFEKGKFWPIPRFTAGVYVVTDNLTGLIWVKSVSAGKMQWSQAIDYCTSLVIWEPAGGPFSILYDNWRLPNVKELLSLIDYSNQDPALITGHPFINVHLDDSYWTSTTYVGDTDYAWNVNINEGRARHGYPKSYTVENISVWAVHDRY